MISVVAMTLTHKERTNEVVPRGMTALGLVVAFGSVLAIIAMPASPETRSNEVRRGVNIEMTTTTTYQAKLTITGLGKR